VVTSVLPASFVVVVVWAQDGCLTAAGLETHVHPEAFPYSSGNGSSEPVVDELLTTVAEFRVGASEADLWLLGVTRGKGRMRVTSAHRFGTSQPRHVTGSVKRSFAPHES